MVDDDDDEVVRELDVFVSDKLELLLLQFPLKPCYSEPPTDIHSIKYKPGNKKLELEIPYPPEIIKGVVDVHGNKPDKYQKFASSAITQSMSLAVGVIRDNSFHINPLKEVLQLRPSFKDLKSNEIVEMLDDEEEVQRAKPAEVKEIGMKVKESDRAQSARVQSYAHLQMQEEQEPWNKVSFFEIDSDQTLDLFEQMYFNNETEES